MVGTKANTRHTTIAAAGTVTNVVHGSSGSQQREIVSEDD
jgi:hypothetical protein